MTARSPVNPASLALQTPAQLAGLRDSHKSVAAHLARRGHRVGQAWEALGMLGVLLAVVSGIMAGSGLSGTSTEALAVAAVSSVFGLAVVLTGMGTVNSLGMVLGATWLAAALVPSLGMAPAVPVATALLAGALLAGIAIVVRVKIEEPRRSALRALARLDELDADRHPAYCVSMVDLCDAHPEVQAFQARIAAMGRRPTVEELEVAERWASGKVLRDEEALAMVTARQACARLDPGNADGLLKGAANA